MTAPHNEVSDSSDDLFDIEGQESYTAEAEPTVEPTTSTADTATTTTDDSSDEGTETAEPTITAVKVGDQADEPVAEPTVDADPNDITDIVGPDGKYMTYREAAKATRSLQSMKDKEIKEIREAQADALKQNEQWNQWYQQQEAARQEAEYQQQAAAAAMPSSEQELVYNIEVDPMGTFRNAMQLNPQLVPSIVAHVRQTKGDHLAETMLAEQGQYQAMLIAQQQQQAWSQQQDQVSNLPSPEDNTRSALEAVRQHYGEEFTKMEQDVSSAVEEGNYNIDFSNPASIAGAVENAYLRVFREKAMQEATKTSQQPQAVSPQSETGSPGQAPVVSEDQSIIDEIMELKTTPWG